MPSFDDLSDDAVLLVLGERLAQRRVEQDLTQTELAKRAGVARGVVQRVELGESLTTSNLVRILRALHALDELDNGLPDLGPSPLEALERDEGRRRRVRRRRAELADSEFRWGGKS